MASSELETLIAQIPKNFADPTADFRAVREMFAPFHGHPVGADLNIQFTELGGVRTAFYSTPETQSARRIVFHCHGGAFVSCSLDVYHFYAETIVRLTGSRVVMPDYRLAPETIYPGAHDDCFFAYRGLLESGVDPKSICLFGESCGGSLALGLLSRARAENLPMPACFVSLTGWFDLSVAAVNPLQPDPFLTPQWVRNRAADYLAGAIDARDPLVSPAYADVSGLPPMYLQIGQNDTMREGAIALAANAVRDGVEVIAEGWPDMIHGWHGLAGIKIPEAMAAWRRIADYVNTKVPN